VYLLYLIGTVCWSTIGQLAYLGMISILGHFGKTVPSCISTEKNYDISCSFSLIYYIHIDERRTETRRSLNYDLERFDK